MKWKKLGRIFDPSGYNFPWLHSHAWVPTSLKLDSHTLRIFFGSRNINNHTQTGYFDLNLETHSILNVSQDPILKLGELGTFDDSLAIGCALVTHQDIHYLYYVGWMQGARVRYIPSLGLATSNDGEHFTKTSRAPLIPRSDEEPYGMASPSVIFNTDLNLWQMWYASYRKWDLRGNESWPRYELRYACSQDGINWSLSNKTCIGDNSLEAVARPHVIYISGQYQMWYSYRKNFELYNIGYATSQDGITWTTSSDSGIEPSISGWDSEMIEYPNIFNHNSKLFMLYNGNNHGETGIGLAILE